MRRAAPWLLAAAGMLLAAAGTVVLLRADAPGVVSAPSPSSPAYQSRLSLSFDRTPVLWTTGHLVGAGLVSAGLLVLSGLAGWWLGRRSSRASAWSVSVALLGAVGVLLVVGGVVGTLRGSPGTTTVYSAGYAPVCPAWPVCDPAPRWIVLAPAQLVGSGIAVGGAALLAGVAGRLLAGERRPDQR